MPVAVAGGVGVFVATAGVFVATDAGDDVGSAIIVVVAEGVSVDSAGAVFAVAEAVVAATFAAAGAGEAEAGEAEAGEAGAGEAEAPDDVVARAAAPAGVTVAAGMSVVLGGVVEDGTPAGGPPSAGVPGVMRMDE